MKQHGQHTHHEILSQPDDWAEAIAFVESEAEYLWNEANQEEN